MLPPDWRTQGVIYFDLNSGQPCVNYPRVLRWFRRFRDPPLRLPLSLPKLHSSLRNLTSPLTAVPLIADRQPSRCTCHSCRWKQAQPKRRVSRTPPGRFVRVAADEWLSTIFSGLVLTFLLVYLLKWIVLPHGITSVAPTPHLRWRSRWGEQETELSTKTPEGAIYANNPATAAKLRELAAADNAKVASAESDNNVTYTESVSTNEPPSSMLSRARPSHQSRLDWCRGDNYLEKTFDQLLQSAQATALPLAYLEDPQPSDPLVDCAPVLAQETYDLDEKSNGRSLLHAMRCSSQRQLTRRQYHQTFRPVSLGVATQMHRITYAELASGTWGMMLSVAGPQTKLPRQRSVLQLGPRS
eukprot:Gregarina_sp_Poly_1__8067@NODE_463_length_8191_cov_61_524372_g377_i0_p5_GENE_NODE_463_length_8191_cov_61_524372_g377_i0NODE_463_length_8191_cov_61_524372_g377_i0_p5_ORF_typecomplete_len356_score41_71_NODE_463_length_8191_cov_61_524372_g377_i0171084